MFALVDCNSFYASCEKIFRPDLTKKPVIVLSNNDGCVIARSPEAKKMGVAMGQPWFQVKNQYLKSDGIVFSSNYELYADISNRVMNILSEICPEIDIYSIDEAFLDLRTFEKNIDLVNFAFQCKNRIKDWVGIPVSIGIAPTKTLAKIANRIAKEDSRFQGVVILQNKRAINHYLKATPVEKIWGVGKRLSLKLKDLGVKIFNADGDLVELKPKKLEWELGDAELGGYPTFMLKEIYEQSSAVGNTLDQRIADGRVLQNAFGPDAETVFDKARSVHIVACGTSYHAGLIAKYWIESICQIPCRVEIASEYRYRNPVVMEDTLFIAISQSGETADTVSYTHLTLPTNREV